MGLYIHNPYPAIPHPKLKLIHTENEELLEITVGSLWEYTVGKVFAGVFKKRTGVDIYTTHPVLTQRKLFSGIIN